MAIIAEEHLVVYSGRCDERRYHSTK